MTDTELIDLGECTICGAWWIPKPGLMLGTAGLRPALKAGDLRRNLKFPCACRGRELTALTAELDEQGMRWLKRHYDGTDVRPAIEHLLVSLRRSA